MNKPMPPSDKDCIKAVFELAEQQQEDIKRLRESIRDMVSDEGEWQ